MVSFKFLTVPLLLPSLTLAWVHPGYVVSQAQLSFVASQVLAGKSLWTDAYNAMLDDSDRYGGYASGTRTSTATATVGCGPTTTPDNGCTDERGDALAAYAHALAWAVSGTPKFATYAIDLMNKWSYVVKTHTLSNAILQASWAGASWVRAGEIIRTSGYLSAADLAQFKSMLKNAYLPAIQGGDPTSNSNWDISCLSTTLGIAVFLEDQDLYSSTLALFEEDFPSMIYLDSDGSLPVAVRGTADTTSALRSRWYNQQTWGNSGQDGDMQETCRDLTHTGYSLASAAHIMETARIQGTKDYYNGTEGERLRFGLGFHSGFEEGVAHPSWLCQNKALTQSLGPVTEIGYNALGFRLGNAMTHTSQYTSGGRPWGTNSLYLGWETLTHAENPN